jgi:hypothetical protein
MFLGETSGLWRFNFLRIAVVKAYLLKIEDIELRDYSQRYKHVSVMCKMNMMKLHAAVSNPNSFLRKQNLFILRYKFCQN